MISPLSKTIEGVTLRLNARWQELQRRLAAVQSDLQRAREPLSPDFAEQATQRENDEVLESLRRGTEEEMREVQLALRRVESGTYGSCCNCHEPIEPSRLEALPQTQRCASCASVPGLPGARASERPG